MLICKIGEYLKKKLYLSSPSPVPGTPFHKIAEEIIGMASAYHDDGFSFHRTGDRVNAFASFAYGIGWLDAGIFLGLVKTPDDKIISSGFLKGFDEKVTEMLTEKTGRYERMLFRAIQSIRSYPDKSSPSFCAADEILIKTRRLLDEGVQCHKKEIFWIALWDFSYGYGWLDAGIRAGLIEVVENRQLFTVD